MKIIKKDYTRPAAFVHIVKVESALLNPSNEMNGSANNDTNVVAPDGTQPGTAGSFEVGGILGD